MDELELRSIARHATRGAPPGPVLSVPAVHRGDDASSRRRGAADDIFERTGARLHAFACTLTSDPATAAGLVVDAIASRSCAGADDSEELLRVLAADTYVLWSYEPLPESSDLVDSSASERAIHLLPDPQRVALALCMFGDHTYAQTAELMELTDVEVTRLLQDALAFLAPVGRRNAAM